MTKPQGEIEGKVKAISERAHVKWLWKCKTAVINGNEMTVFPYGYFQTAIIEVLKEAIREAREVDINLLTSELRWCQKNKVEGITKEQRKWFIEGLIQAIVLLQRPENKIDWENIKENLNEK